MALLKTIGAFSILWCLKSYPFQLLLFVVSAFWSCPGSQSRSEKDLLAAVKKPDEKQLFAEIFVRQSQFSPIVLLAGGYFVSCFIMKSLRFALSCIPLLSEILGLARPVGAASTGGCSVWLPPSAPALLSFCTGNTLWTPSSNLISAQGKKRSWLGEELRTGLKATSLWCLTCLFPFGNPDWTLSWAWLSEALDSAWIPCKLKVLLKTDPNLSCWAQNSSFNSLCLFLLPWMNW